MSATDSFPGDLTAFFQNDLAASRTIVDRLAPPLMALIRRELAGRLQSRVDPEDVCQSAFGSFCRRYLAGEIAVEDWPRLWGLLSTIAMRKCHRQFEYHLAACRDPRREIPIELVPHSETSICAESGAVSDTLDELLANCDATERSVALLYLQGFTYDEIAVHLTVSARTARRIIARIRDQFSPSFFQS